MRKGFISKCDFSLKVALVHTVLLGFNLDNFY